MKSFSTSVKVLLLSGLFISQAFNARSQYTVNGSAAANGDDCYILTQFVGNQCGSVWYANLITLAEDFDMTFQVYLGSYDNDGADGIAFVMQPTSTALGIAGGGLGYLGISPSIAVEYDTWQNDDPWYDHISVQRNGDVNYSGAVAGPVQASATSFNIEDNQWHTTRITWDAETFTLAVYFDNALRLSYTNDIVTNTYSGNPAVYWGFTGSTGGAANVQQFCITSVTFGEYHEVPLSPWIFALSILVILGVTILRLRKSL